MRKRLAYHKDWGERSPRWAGIHSEVVEVRGMSVHLLRAGAGPNAPLDAPTQLLIHPMGASGTFWLDVMRPCSAHGPVVAPDLPGSLAGRTVSAHRNPARAEDNARFLSGLTSWFGLERLVVHGWSFGGLVALLFADLESERVAGLVLVNATLPRPLTAAQRIGWRTLGRLALLVGPPVARVLLGLLGRKLFDLKLRRFNAAVTSGKFDIAGGDLSRLSPEMTALLADEFEGMRSRPRQLGDAVTAFASAVSAMYVDHRPAGKAIDRVTAPTLLLWGDQDPLIDRAAINHLIAWRPDWNLHVFETVGHLLPMEVPEDYVAVVGRWLEEHRDTLSGKATRIS